MSRTGLSRFRDGQDYPKQILNRIIKRRGWWRNI